MSLKIKIPDYSRWLYSENHLLLCCLCAKLQIYGYLATNIFDTSFTPEMFSDLYFLRWPVELKYLELKERLKIEDFNGATPVSIIQEFYIGMFDCQTPAECYYPAMLLPYPV